MPKNAEQEKDFQTQANDYAKIAIENIRQMVFALEHAGECSGETDCETCAGDGVNPNYIEGDETLCSCDNRSWVGDEHDTACELEGPREKYCTTCKGAGTVACKEGADSDDPESWHDEERARERIEEDALSVEVRSDWHTPGDSESQKPTEYQILLTTGGPAARITGDLDDYGQPSSAKFEYQDWFKPWTEAHTDSADDAVMMTYVQQFYFGE